MKGEKSSVDSYKIKAITEDKTELINQIRDLAWMDISAKKKEIRLQALLPWNQEEHESHFEQFSSSATDQEDPYYEYLAQQSQSLQQRASPILKNLSFQPNSSDKDLIEAIAYFRKRNGTINKSAPTAFLSEKDQGALWNKDREFRVSLYKMLLFQQSTDAIKRGSLNLKYSYKYRTVDDYLIPKDIWDKDQDSLLEKANLFNIKEPGSRISDYKKMIAHHFTFTNTRILKGKNNHFRKSKKGNYHI